MSFTQALTIVPYSLSLLVLIHFFRAYRQKYSPNPKGLPYAPGPKRLPMVGNLFQMPLSHPWLTYTEWSKRFGDVMYTSVCGQGILILNSPEAVSDLLEKRSANYSDRPHLPMLVDLMGYGWQLLLMSQGPMWRLQRKIFHRHFNQSVSQKYTGLLTRHTRKCLAMTLQEPENIIHHMTYYLASTVFRIVYGIDIKEKDDPHLSTALEVVLGETSVGVPGAFLVDIFPILKCIPSWFPGAGFQRIAKYYLNLQDPVRDVPVKSVQKAMLSGNYKESMVSELLSGQQDGTLDTLDSGNEDMFQVIKDVASIAFLGAAETVESLLVAFVSTPLMVFQTSSTLQIFILTMLLYPEIQEKANAEIVRTIGCDRLPEFHEVDAIPYVHAVVKELLRWQPVGPLGIPHSNRDHDEYRGYHIPKGTTVIPNVWAILHDEKTYPEPYSFHPERFLSPDGSLRKDIMDPSDYAFGFGRRVCPGRPYAYNSLVILVASFIVAFKVNPDEAHPLPKIEKDSQEICPTLMGSGLALHPHPFKCKIEPRSNVISRELLEEKFQDH